ncbi:FGGY family carbohydrate kinase [Paracoccus tegillarcae]|uniref:Glycerol kinase n=1 Tax=Paracoccus tegillarcae TaxID=1529068 RepID=A0A2K9EQJ5_9RHOB|nr:FGGY-family carbohydrate kinase [Paracoccus tegillarcae]AUH33016.1 glycerol kinase [Paracoccus tegillarcae]
MSRRVVLAIDEGTTNSKAVMVDEAGRIIASGSAPVPIDHPRSGWVQQDAEAIWQATLTAIGACLQAAPDVEIVALGISNQRESILIWDRATGQPLGPVISWQCRRTAAGCEALRDAGHEAEVIARTGLPLDPMFPATKAAWLQKHHGGGTNICIGTVDSWLIWKLTGGRVHATDRSNAARTQLFNLAEGQWDEWLCALFGIDQSALPVVCDSAHDFGVTQADGPLPGGIPIASAIGDSHAALFSHGAFGSGDGKVTFGTGSSVMTTIPDFIIPPQGITTTIAWSLNGTSTFAFEGNILVSAAILPWTAALLGLDGVEALLDLAQTVPDSGGVSLVPAHVGLGAPYWDADARGLVCGLSFGSGPAQIARASADSMALQVQAVFAIMAEAAGGIGRLSVDGGPSRNRFLMQLVADYLNHPVTPCRNAEASALGAAYLAGLKTGFWADLDALTALISRDAHITPQMQPETRIAALESWRMAIARTTAQV